jgi:hypothetical protein
VPVARIGGGQVYFVTFLQKVMHPAQGNWGTAIGHE